MRLHVQLIVVLFAVHARAATVPSLNVEKKLSDVPVTSDKEVPLENVSSEQELIDSANTIKDVENNLRVKAADIPVKVIIEEPKINTGDSSSDYKRLEIDLSNPGEPQRQEHETQNPVHYEHEQQIVTAVKQSVLDTEANLRQGFQGVSENIQNWISNNQQLADIQQSIQGLQQSFMNQFTRLNETIQSYLNNQKPSNSDQSGEPQKLVGLENELKTLEDNFKIGVKALSEGVEVFATLKEENPTTQAPTSPNNIFIHYLQLLQQSVTQGFTNVTQAFQNYVGQNNNNTNTGGFLQGLNSGIQNIFNQGSTPAGAQSDETVTPKPSIWQGFQSSIENILKPGQSQSGDTAQGTPNRPIAQAISNLPFVQGVVNFINPSKPEAQPQATKPSDTTPNAPVGTNAVPVTAQPVKPSEEKPAINNEGPIKNIIQNNPIVKGISGAVQKLQSISNPEKPRDTVAEQPVVADGESKGHGSSSSGDNNDSSNSDATVENKNELNVVNIENDNPEIPKNEDKEKKVQIEKTEEP